MLNQDEVVAYCAWSRVQGVGPGTLRRFRDRLGSLTAAWQAAPGQLVEQGGVDPARVGAMVRARALLDPEALWRSHEASGFELVIDGDTRYPELLRHIAVPPMGLWVLGPLEVQARAIALVGTRRPSPYGRRVAGRLAADLAAEGVVVVSGLALGIDGEAHEGAISTGRTWAVLGSGLDRVHPASHRGLARRIIQAGGCLISEYPPETEPAPWRFPARNRIVSGLCQGTVVIEAPARSGALLTAGHALEQDREVMAVPGPVDSPGSAGPHALMRDGARPVRDAADVLLEFGWPCRGRPDAPGLEGDQQAVWLALGGDPRSVELLPASTGLSPGRVQAALTHLLLSGRVAFGPQGWYTLS